jgi:hypothetical protein
MAHEQAVPKRVGDGGERHGGGLGFMTALGKLSGPRRVSVYTYSSAQSRFVVAVLECSYLATSFSSEGIRSCQAALV